MAPVQPQLAVGRARGRIRLLTATTTLAQREGTTSAETRLAFAAVRFGSQGSLC